MAKSENLSKVEDLVERYYHKENIQEKEHLYEHGKIFCYYKFDYLNFISIGVIINDNNQFYELFGLKIELPFPSEVFSHLGLDFYGNLLGELVFWWGVYWEHFCNILAE